MKKRYAVAVTALVVAGGLSGCGAADRAAEKVDVKQAAAWMDDADVMQYTISVKADAAALEALQKSDPDHAQDLPADASETLNGARVVVTGSAKDARQPGSVVVTVADRDVVSMVTDEKTLFLKVDPQAIPGSLTKELGDKGADLTKLAAMVDLFAPGAGAALRNEWVEFDLIQLQKLGGGSVTPTPDAATTQKAQKIVKDLIASSTITKDEADPSHRTATVSGARISEALKQLTALGGGMAGTLPKTRSLEDADVPENVVLDLYLDGDRLHRMGVDLMQFAEKSSVKEGFDLLVDLDEGTAVTAPEGAQKVDLSKLGDGLSGLLGQGLAGGALGDDSLSG